MGPDEAGLRVRPVALQGQASGEGWTSRRVLAFGDDYDPDWSGVGPLVALNVETLEAGRGFAPHAHAGVEVVTLVLDGEVEHTDDRGEVVRGRPGQVLLLASGAGLRHAERATSDAPARLVASWLVDGEPAGAPTVTVVDLPPEGLAAPPLRTPGTRLRRVRLDADDRLALPGAPARAVLLVLGGGLRTGAGDLAAGDAAVWDGDGDSTGGLGADRVRGGEDGADVLVWDLSVVDLAVRGRATGPAPASGGD